MHLIVRGGPVNLEDAEFLRRSILEKSAFEPYLADRLSPEEHLEGFDELTVAAQARWAAAAEAFQLAQQLADELRPPLTTRTQVVSLRRATAGDLVLSGIGLEDCAFAGAHGLDMVRIGATCSVQLPPVWRWDTWRPFTRRRIIFEEARWRLAHTMGWSPVSITSTASAELDNPVPTALEIRAPDIATAVRSPLGV